MQDYRPTEAVLLFSMADSSRRHETNISEADDEGPTIRNVGDFGPHHNTATQPSTRPPSPQARTSRTQQLLAGRIGRRNLRPTAGAILSSIQQPNEEPASSHSSDRTARPFTHIIKAHFKKALSKPKRLFNKLLATSTSVDGAGNPTRSETRDLPSNPPTPDTDASLVFERVERPADTSSNRTSHSAHDEPTLSPKEDATVSSTNLIPPTKNLSENEVATGRKHHRTGSLRTQLIINEKDLPPPPPSISTRSTTSSPELPDLSDQQLQVGENNDQGTPPLDIHAVIIHPGRTPSGKKAKFKRQPAIVHLDTCCSFDAVSGAFANRFELGRNTEHISAELANGKHISVTEWVWLALEATAEAKPKYMKFRVVEGARSWNILFGIKTITANNLLEKARDPRPKNFWILTGDDGKDLSPGKIR